MKCAACGAVWYCSRAHQRGHWKAHKVECRGGKAKGRAIGAGGAGGKRFPTALCRTPARMIVVPCAAPRGRASNSSAL